jgi:RNA polymerase sigma factor (TIGR02999 family)
MPPPEQVTQLLQAWSNGDQGALDSLFPLIYRELRRLAASHLRRERSNHTLQPTALVNEAYLRLADCEKIKWRDRLQFYAAASKVMRHILIDYARAHQAAKRGGKDRTVALDEACAISDSRDVNLVALDDALRTLETLDPQKATIVELRFFGGLSLEETASVMAISVRTANRKWQAARAWLHREISRKDGHDISTPAAG